MFFAALLLACTVPAGHASVLDFQGNPLASFMLMDITKEIVRSVSTSDEYQEGVLLLKVLIVNNFWLIKIAIACYLCYRAYLVLRAYQKSLQPKFGHDLEWSRRTNVSGLKNEALPDEFLFIAKHFEGSGGLQMTLTDLDKCTYKVKVPTKGSNTLTYEKNGQEWFTIALQNTQPGAQDKIVERSIFQLRFATKQIYGKYLELEEEWRQNRSSHSRGFEVVRNLMDEQNPYSVKGGYQLSKSTPYSSQLLIMKKMYRLLSRGFCPMVILSSVPGTGKTVLSKLMARYVNWNLMKVSQSETSLWFHPEDGPRHLIEFFKFLQEKTNGADKYIVFCDEFDSFVSFLKGDYEALKLSPSQVRRLTCILKEYIGNIQCVLVIASNEKVQNSDLEVSGLHDRTIIFNPQGIEVSEWIESLFNDPLNLGLFAFSEKEGMQCFEEVFDGLDLSNVMDSRFFKMMVEDNIVEFQHEFLKRQKESKRSDDTVHISSQDFKSILQLAKVSFQRRFENSNTFEDKFSEYVMLYEQKQLPFLSRQDSCESTKEKEGSISKELSAATALNIIEVNDCSKNAHLPTG